MYMELVKGCSVKTALHEGKLTEEGEPSSLTTCFCKIAAADVAQQHRIVKVRRQICRQALWLLNDCASWALHGFPRCFFSE
jgi:hypothetical protein